MFTFTEGGLHTFTSLHVPVFLLYSTAFAGTDISFTAGGSSGPLTGRGTGSVSDPAGIYSGTE